MCLRARHARACLALLGLLPSGVAVSGPRVALVIGNSAYQHTDVLRNPKKDASAIADALQGLGYSVQWVMDATKPAMENALVEFAASTRGADQAIIFFSGHGIEVKGVNYILPVEVRLASESTVALEAVSLPQLMDVARNARHLGLVVLDACRDDPLANSMERNDGTRGAGNKGFARVEPSGSNVLVAYAARQGRVAADGKGDHSPYTEAILDALKVPGLEVRQFFGRVRDRVWADTRQAQEPSIYGTLGEEALYLHLPASADARQPDRHSQALEMEAETALWNGALRLNTPDAYRAYLDKYPQGRFAAMAKLSLVPQERTSNGTASSSANPPGPEPPPRESDCEICPKMVHIEGGSFLMGSPEIETGRYSDEGPQHRVQVRSFSIGKHDVTFDEWDACVADGGCKTRPSDSGWGRGTRPVINVSWEDAQQYASWVSRKTGQVYRLPTEAEWEYAARAGTTTAYYWGGTIETGHANCDGCGSRWDNKQTSPVGSFDPNPLGLYDMAGNVWQWTQDCYNNSYAGVSNNGGAQLKGDCVVHVARGGSWGFSPPRLRVAARFGGLFPDVDVGFRLARTD